VVHDRLAGQTRLAQKALAFQDLQLRPRHHLGLALQVLHPAGGATRVAPAAVEYLHARVLLYSQDQPLPPFDLDRPNALDFEFRHAMLLSPVALCQP